MRKRVGILKTKQMKQIEQMTIGECLKDAEEILYRMRHAQEHDEEFPDETDKKEMIELKSLIERIDSFLNSENAPHVQP